MGNYDKHFCKSREQRKKISRSRDHELKTFLGTRGFINGEEGIKSKKIKGSWEHVPPPPLGGAQNCTAKMSQKEWHLPGAHQMEPSYLLISWVNPFPRRFINRTIFFCNALESHECACCLLSFLYVHWLFPLSARETSPGNRSIYKSTRERVDSKGLHGRYRLHLMGSCTFTALYTIWNLVASPGGEDKFGYYKTINPLHRCTSRDDATTQCWFREK